MALLTKPLNDLRRAQMACTLCPDLGACVPSVGPSSPLLFIIGQSPGESEADTGIPFVGAAGDLLSRLLAEAGVPRSACFITNAVHCHPAKNRPSSPDELANCQQHLSAELELLRPPAVFCLGRDAYRIFSKRIPWGHGVYIPTAKPRVLLSYHPAYFLRQGDLSGFMALATRVKELVYGDPGGADSSPDPSASDV